MTQMGSSGSLWRRHFHWSVLLQWEVLGWILGFLIAIGGILLVFDQYWWANACFVTTAIFILGKTAHVAIASEDAWWQRMLFTFLLFGLVGVVIVESVKGVNRWAAKHSDHAAPSTATAPVIYPETDISRQPAGYLTFVGQVIDGFAAMMQVNQTEIPLDDVRLQIIETIPEAAEPSSDTEWESGTVVWQKEIEVGTCRARLSIGLSERFPVGGENRIEFYIVILTRLQTYREVIQLTKNNDNEYRAYLRFYGPPASPAPLYEQRMTLGIASAATGQQPKTPAGRPEVEMYFVDPQNVQWRIKNRSSSVVVENALYWFFLINIDHPVIVGNVVQPLRIPSQKVDFINPSDFSGGIVLPPEVQQAVRAGDRIFGTAEVNCPGCKDKGYWLYFKQGEGGWFSKMHGHTSRGLNFPIGSILADPEKEIDNLVPLYARMPIKEEQR